MNGDNMNNLICEASRAFKTKKINEPETNSNNKNIRNLQIGVNEFKKV
jgi:hypothetical protein